MQRIFNEPFVQVETDAVVDWLGEKYHPLATFKLESGERCQIIDNDGEYVILVLFSEHLWYESISCIPMGVFEVLKTLPVL